MTVTLDFLRPVTPKDELDIEVTVARLGKSSVSYGIDGRIAATGVTAFAAFVLIALAAPILTAYDPTKLDLLSALQNPSLAHPFGTDYLGRDVLTRVIFGAQVDLQIGLIGVSVPFVIGTIVGLLAGYFGGITDAIIGRVIDVVIAFPFLVLVVAIVAMLGPGLVNLYIAITVVSWVLYARIVRGEVLALRSREYVLAARSLSRSC